MIIKNRDIRQEAKVSGVRLWEIGEKMEISDANFSRMLRKELGPEIKKRIYNIIEELKEVELTEQAVGV